MVVDVAVQRLVCSFCTRHQSHRAHKCSHYVVEKLASCGYPTSVSRPLRASRKAAPGRWTLRKCHVSRCTCPPIRACCVHTDSILQNLHNSELQPFNQSEIHGRRDPTAAMRKQPDCLLWCAQHNGGSLFLPKLPTICLQHNGGSLFLPKLPTICLPSTHCSDRTERRGDCRFHRGWRAHG